MLQDVGRFKIGPWLLEIQRSNYYTWPVYLKISGFLLGMSEKGPSSVLVPLITLQLSLCFKVVGMNEERSARRRKASV